MPSTGTHEPPFARPALTPGLSNLAWKVLLAALLALLLLLGVAFPASLLWQSTWVALIAWGGLVVALLVYALYSGPADLRPWWVALALGAYAALAVPVVWLEPSAIGSPAQEPGSLVQALGPVTALTLAAHLGRRDLSHAYRDWAVIMAAAVYGALGAVAMSQAIIRLGLFVFFVAVMLPPLLAEAIILAGNRARVGRPLVVQAAAIVLAVLISLVTFSLTSLNSTTPAGWLFFFNAIAGLIIGGGLLLAFLSMPFLSSLPIGSPPAGRAGAGRSLLEFSHGAICIALVIFVVLRLVQ